MKEIARNTLHLTQAQLYSLADSMGVCGPHSQIKIEEVHEEDSSHTHSTTIIGTFKRQMNIVARTGRLYPQEYLEK